MAKSLLPESFDRTPAAEPELATAPARRSSNAGKYHLGGYFAPDDPVVQGFRMLVARTHRRQQDLLTEALTLLIDKHRADEAFGK